MSDERGDSTQQSHRDSGRVTAPRTQASTAIRESTEHRPAGDSGQRTIAEDSALQLALSSAQLAKQAKGFSKQWSARKTAFRNLGGQASSSTPGVESVHHEGSSIAAYQRCQQHDDNRGVRPSRNSAKRHRPLLDTSGSASSFQRQRATARGDTLGVSPATATATPAVPVTAIRGSACFSTAEGQFPQLTISEGQPRR